MNDPEVPWNAEDTRPRHIEINLAPVQLVTLGLVLLCLLWLARIEAEADERNDIERLKLPTERHGKLEDALFP